MVLKPGDKIEYAREDAGGDISWKHPVTGVDVGWRFAPTYAHLENGRVQPPEHIIVGTNIPLDLCQRLVEDGICRVVETEDPSPATGRSKPIVNTPAKDASATSEAPADTP